MKGLYSVVISLVLIISTAGVAGNLKVPRLKTTSSFNHPVVSQTVPEFLEKRGPVTFLRRFYISRWGVHRFEYGYADYQCKNSKCELRGEPTSLRFYESCQGFLRNGRPNCTRTVSARVDVNDPLESNESKQRRWYSCEDYGSPCRDNDDWNEYPSRYSPEDRESGLNF
ncbi:MAG: hypothetical protein ACK5V3_04410 [Bdellovibrionales bacterium]